MNGFIKIWIGCAAALLAAGCGYDDFGEPHPADETAPLPNMSVATLRERCAVGPVAFSGSGVVLSGYVTTSDRADNFYRTLMLEDNSGAVEVCAGLYDLHNDYPVGCRLTLSADGLTAALDDGLLRIGLRGGDGTRRPDGESGDRAASSVANRRNDPADSAADDDRRVERRPDRLFGADRPAVPRYAVGYDLGRPCGGIGRRYAAQRLVEIPVRSGFCLCLYERLRFVCRRTGSARAGFGDRYSAARKSGRTPGV